MWSAPAPSEASTAPPGKTYASGMNRLRELRRIKYTPMPSGAGSSSITVAAGRGIMGLERSFCTGTRLRFVAVAAAALCLPTIAGPIQGGRPAVV